ncbi:MAG: ABC transporter permease [Acidobacteria bacterium]|nr:ABC transporter permease [Acidobacteriota bacterium]
MLEDLRCAVRALRRSPMTGAVSALTLGLGIGGAAAVFSVVDAVLLRPLPFPHPERLVRIWEVTPDGTPFSMSPANYLDLRAAARSLDTVAAYGELDSTAVLTEAGDPRRVLTVPVSSSMAGVLGISPALGRHFSADEDHPASSQRAVILGDGLWRERFDGDLAVVGRSIVLDGQRFTVVGVMPAGFDFPARTEAWIPLRADARRDRDDKELAVVARLAPGATLAQARGELREFARRLSQDHPQSNAGWSADALPFHEWIVAPRVRHGVWVLFGAVGLLLLLACANVANLLIALGIARQGEIRIRMALGATRGRLARQLFTESALLAVFGIGAGVLVAMWSVEAVHVLGDGRIPRLDSVRIDSTVLGFACLAGIMSCVLFGIAPALHAVRVDPGVGMHAGVRYTPGGRRIRQGLVIVEVALALILLVGAGLLGNSFLRLLRVDTGFQPAGLIAMPLNVSPDRYAGDRLAAFYADLLERVRGLPSVAAAGATSTDPFRQFGFSNTVTPEERAAEAPASGLVQAGWRSVTPGFFEAMGIPVLAGRTFTATDRQGGERVVVVSASLARQLWPGQGAVGRRIFWGGTSGRTRTVVGVTGDFRDVRPEAEPDPMLFLPHAQVDLPAMTLIVRSPLDIGQMAPALRFVLREADAALPPGDIHRVEASRVEAAAEPRFHLSLLAAFAAIALVLAVSGVYATMAFDLAERRREIAVRLALGASPRAMAGLLLREGTGLAVAGTIAGAAVAAGLARALRSLLFDVAPTDPWTFAVAAATVVIAAAAACYLPARRAGRLDPLTILRQ